MQIETPPAAKPYDKPEGERRGLVIVNTGDGKGKSTAAFGLALRAHGRRHVHGKNVRIFQFMKVPTARFGEHRMFEQIGIPIEDSATASAGKARTWRIRRSLRAMAGTRPERKSSVATTSWSCWTSSPTP